MDHVTAKERKAANAKRYYEKHKEEIKAKGKKYREVNKEKIAIKDKEYRAKNRNKLLVSNKKYHAENKEKAAAYYIENKDKMAARMEEYRNKNKDKIAESFKKYHGKNKDKIAVARSARRKQRYKTDYKYRLNNLVSNGIKKSLRSGKGGRSWSSLVDFTLDELIRHLEDKFQPGMTWENQAAWHIDHRIPKAAFNFSMPKHEDFKRCWSLNNLQPMWAIENISKGTKLEKPFQPSLALVSM